VRGAAPEEPRSVLLAANDAEGETKPLLAVGPERPVPTQAPAAPAQAAQSGRWQVHETANFRIMHADAALAERVAETAERTREAQTKRWSGAAPREPWSPKCDVYLYPSARIFSTVTGQPEDSPGFSTMGMNAGRITARRVNLRADHPNLVGAILPHEVTHVVLADFFTERQVPRWADEGMAVLAEPPGEQRHRAADLNEPLTSGRVFRMGDLMVMDYPSAEHWALYYAQSVSLTRFLVERGTPAQFIEFVRGCQRRNHEDELRRVYQIDGYAELQRLWIEYARTTLADNVKKDTETARR
jgi:hypothetical protein